MTLNISASSWAKAGIVIGALLLVAGLWAYLAGGIFLLSQSRSFNDATPLTFYQYWYYYDGYPAVHKWLTVSGGISLAILFAPALIFFAPAKKRSLFGDAQFATARDIRKAGLLGEQGILVGRTGNWFTGYRYLMFPGSQHVLISAPTRSGKGVGAVIPNLLNWPDSVVVLDVKQENWGITSGYRARHGQACYLFNPAATDYRTHRYNPLSYISEDPNFRIDDIQKIANMLFPDQPGTDPIWTATPRSLFLGIVLYLCETKDKPVTLGQVLRESLIDGDGSRHFASVINTRALGAYIRQTAPADAATRAVADIDAVLADRNKAPAHHPRIGEMAAWFHLHPAYSHSARKHCKARAAQNPETPDISAILTDANYDRASINQQPLSGTCVRALNTYVSISADATRSGIIGGFRSRLELWNNPLVDAATSGNDFDLRKVRKRRMSIYLGVTPDNLERMTPLLNLFFQQLLDLNTRELPQQDRALKYQCLMLMDEFAAIGRMAILSKGISYIAGYGLRMMPIFQSPAQLAEVYGKEAAQTFTTNHALQVVYPPKRSETQTARDISEWLGYQTVKGVSHSKTKGIFAKRSPSENVSDQRRALLLPQEITGLKKGTEIVVAEDVPPILARKIVYYQDRAFLDRLKAVSPSLAALGRKVPTEAQFGTAVERRELCAPVPLIDMQAHHQSTGGDALGIPQPPPTASPTMPVQPVTADDMPRLASLLLHDALTLDFSSVKAPAAGTLDEPALIEFVDDMCRQAGIRVTATTEGASR